MAETYRVNLAFTADTAQAKQQLQSLQTSLNSLINNTATTNQQLGISKELQESISLANSLKVALQQATDASTGKLDLGAFNQSLKQSGTTLNDYENALTSLGAEGQETFMDLANAVIAAEMPLKRTNKLVNGIWIGLKNTINWKISQSALEAFTGSIQSAYNYAQDLNESLNNIRIVTGQSVDQMADFAKEANKAAKALSTTTTEYTNASLIYYQQGLSDQEVKDRTDITIKMANAAQQSAEIVSDQLTAVWNNFYDGSKSLEYYADVMVRLGADTASSTDEISEGLNKFASVADTVGLSYEYAASALATVTATTRQSADVVGTAFKTLFARIQDLELGNTLDDGTTLGKYSEALAAVGINIKDSTGSLKDMDVILDEMGSKWSQISKDQQVALAQNVAGTRQYTQLIALMDNWDFFQQNLTSAYGATGSLDEQTDIYAESWEAARDRVKTAAEDIYDSLIDEDFFIEFDNTLEDILSGVARLIDSLGGMKGVIFALSSVITGLFHDKISAALNDLFYNFNTFSEKGKKQMQELKNLASTLQINNAIGTNPEQNSKLADLLQKQKAVYDELSQKAEQLSEFDQQRIISLTDQTNELSKQALQLQHQAEIEQQNANAAVQQLYGRYRTQSDTNPNVYTVDSHITQSVSALQRINELYYSISSYDIGGTLSKSLNPAVFEQLEDYLTNIGLQYQNDTALQQAFGTRGAAAFKQLKDAVSQGTVSYETLEQVLGQLQDQGYRTENVLATVLRAFGGASAEQAAQDARWLASAMEQAGDAAVTAENGFRGAINMIKLAGKIADQAKPKILTLGETITTSVQALSNLGMGLTSIKGVIDTLNNEDLSFFDKFSTIATQSGFMMTSFTSLGSNLKPLKDSFSNYLNKIKKDYVKGLDPNDRKYDILDFTGLIGNKDIEDQASYYVKLYKEGIINQEDLNGLIGQAVELEGKSLEKLIPLADKTDYLGDALQEKILSGLKSIPDIISNIMVKAGPVLAIAAAITAIYAIYKGLYNQSDKGKLEGAETAVEELNNSVTELKENLSGVSSAFDNYKSLVDALDECEKGTDEWNEALKNVKNSIWELLEAYPELLELDNLYNEDGTLNQDTIQDYINGQEKKINQQKIAALSAESYEEELKLNTEKKKIANSNHIDNDTLDYIVSEINNRGKNSYDEIVDSLDVSDKIKSALTKNKLAITEYASNVKASNNSISNQEKLLAQEMLGSNASSELTSQFTEAYQNYMNSDDANNTIAEAKRLALLSGKEKDKNLGNIRDKANEYLAAAGEDLTFVGTDSNGNYLFQDAQGEIQEVLAEVLGAAINGVNAEKVVTNNLKKQWSDALGNGLVYNLNNDVDISYLASMITALENADTKFIYDASELIGKTTEEQEAYLQSLLDSLVTEEDKAAQIISDAAEQYDLDADVLQKQAEALADLYGLDAEAAAELAVQNQRMQEGYEDLVDNWDDWQKALKKDKKGTKEQAQAIVDLTKTIANLVGTSEDLELPDSFFESEENLKLIEQAAKGSEEAINQLGIAVGKVQIKDLEMAEGYQFKIYDSSISPLDQFENYKQTVINGLDDLTEKIKGSGIKIGESLSDIFDNPELAANWVNSLNELALATNMSVDEMNSLLSTIGMKADITITNQKVKTKKPITRTVTRTLGEQWINLDDTGLHKAPAQQTETYSYVSGYTDVWENIQVPQISTDGATGTPNVKYIGNGSVSPTGEPGGSGSSSKPSKVSTKKSDVLDRYKEQDDILDDISDTLDDIAKASDRAFGANRLKLLDQEADAYLRQKEALEEKAEVAAKYYEQDKKALVDKAKSYGINFNFDDKGNISNYTTEMTKLYNELHAAEVKYNSLTTKDAQESYKESTLQPIEDKISELRDLISQFEETRELQEELDQKIKEAFYAWQDANYEKLEYHLELKIDIDDAKLKKLDFLLKQYNDNFYKMAETAATMIDKIPVVNNSLDTYKDHWESLNDAYESGKISQADYIDGLKEARDGMYDQLESLVDLDSEMMHYYEDTLSAATEELDDFTDHLEHLTEVFDHYTSLLELLGKEKDYGAMGDFLGGKATVLRDRLDVAKQYYQELSNQRDLAEAALANASDEHERELLQENLDAIIDEVDAAEEEVLSLTEEWVEAMKTVIQNNMDELASILEDELTGGLGFETLMDNFDKLNTRQEEYLTKTNQIYETNKLMRTANKALDETDNKVAKQKLKNFIEETKSLQENTKLSNYELEIQQAKYDLLLAQIALEEAQNAKSTVRLQRDSEGNYGYVYTADQDAVDDAQQKVEDAENRLYNISLEGQQDYTDKYLQAQQEMYDELTELQEAYLNGEVATDEEYRAKLAEIQNHYYGPDGVLTTYQNLYNVAVRTDADATADYWAKDYGAMTQNTLEWQEAVSEYIGNVSDCTKEWKEVSEQANKDVQNALADSEQATKDLTDESAELAAELQSNVIPAISREIEAVRLQTEAYAAQRKELMDLIETYKSYIDAINDTIEYQSNNLDESSTSTSGISDYSWEMTQAYLKGDWASVQSLAAQREEAVSSGKKSTSVSTDELMRIFRAAKAGDSEADAYIKSVAEKGSKYTASGVADLIKHLDEIQFYETGGYTGEWGPEGKLAVLHDKEIVLNRDDTKNLLSTVSFIRELVNIIDSQAALSKLFNLSSADIGSSNQVIEQKVEITASFPNATNHSEIEEAFTNLINQASQYANRKR